MRVAQGTHGTHGTHGRGSARTPVTLACNECKARNYKTSKSPGATAGEKPLEIQKFCKQCQHHTLHRETK